MEFMEGFHVMTSNGHEVGKITRIVINPVTRSVTHLAVKNGFFLTEEKVIPVEWVKSSQTDTINLSVQTVEYRELPNYEDSSFGNSYEDEAQRKAYLVAGDGPFFNIPLAFGIQLNMYLPDGLSGEARTVERHTPRNTVSLKEGAEVISTDGDTIGQMERMFIDPETFRTSHILIRQGNMRKERRLLPEKWIRFLREDEVFLGVKGYQVQKLPLYLG